MRRTRGEDATVWIGYADFLTTLTVLFLVLVIMVGARSGVPRPARLSGLVVDSTTGAPIKACVATLAELRRDTSDDVGRFELSVDSLRARATVGLNVRCGADYGDHFTLVTLLPGASITDTVRLAKSTTVGVLTLQGDALFAPNDFTLKPEAVETIAALGERLKQNLGRDVIAVQGHTDDLSFSSVAGKDNWVLSGERAAAAAKILTERDSIPECQVVIMGFGPSRPVEPVSAGDSKPERQRKRALNRRIEFRQLRGSALGGNCER